MQAVILAAGRGTRMGDLTIDTPKPLLTVRGKPLLAYKIEAMPPEIKEVVLVIGYLGDRIRRHFGDEFDGRKITYVEDADLKGTAGSLWKAASILTGKFIVMMGDDIYAGADMAKMANVPEWAFLAKRAASGERADRIVVDNSGAITGFMTGEKYVAEFGEGGLMNAGMYSLDVSIFELEPVKLLTKDEYGLPQTILSARDSKRIDIVETDFWIQVTSPDDLKKADRNLE